jgi:site-specific DNA recombinase
MSLETVATDPAQCLRLVESLANFRSRLQMRADTLQVTEQQKILRLLVKEILVGKETLTIRHSIRIPTGSSDPSGITDWLKRERNRLKTGELLRQAKVGWWATSTIMRSPITDRCVIPSDASSRFCCGNG